MFNEHTTVRKTWDRLIESNGNNHVRNIFGQLRDSFEGAVELVRAGHLVTFADGIQAETLGELLDLADGHLARGDLIAAVSTAGGVLETHLRHLVDRHGLTAQGHGSIEKYNSLIGQERNKGNETYSLGDQKQITAWGDARNIADHSPLSFNKSKEEVFLILQEYSISYREFLELSTPRE